MVGAERETIRGLVLAELMRWITFLFRAVLFYYG
jgi:hypothetical protein